MGRIPRGLSHEYCVRISIYNTDRPVLGKIRKRWGGTLTSVPSRNPRWKPSHALIWTNAAAARFLFEISPHLRVKSRQAAVLHQFVQHLQKCRRRRDRLGRLLPFPCDNWKSARPSIGVLKRSTRGGRRVTSHAKPLSTLAEAIGLSLRSILRVLSTRRAV